MRSRHQNPNGPSEAQDLYDYVIVGSGFGGSVAALRLMQKGYSVLVLERGKRFSDADYPPSNWHVRRFLWLPALRLFGIMRMSMFQGLFVLSGSGVGGGSLTYANVLLEPKDAFYQAAAWRDLQDWRNTLAPHFKTAKRMLGVVTNSRLYASDKALGEVAESMGREHTFRPTDVGVFFGEPEVLVPDPYFNGDGPARQGCCFCGGCMVGCRHNAKNTLVKNYLYLAEQGGVEVRAEAEVVGIHPLDQQASHSAQYLVEYRQSTRLFPHKPQRVAARHVILSAGVLGTLSLLFKCRDVDRSLPKLSRRLGDEVRTNSESLLGSTSHDSSVDYSQGIAIGSSFYADEETHIQPVRYPPKSSLIRMLTSPLIPPGKGRMGHLLATLIDVLRHPIDFLFVKVLARWARRTTILLVMQTKDTCMRMRLGRSLRSFFRRALVVEQDQMRPVQSSLELAHQVAHRFARQTKGVAQGSIFEGVFDMPVTAHILGGCPIGADETKGVIDSSCQVFNYPGLYVIDGSIIPANPGVNPSLTITALAEYAIDQIPDKSEQ